MNININDPVQKTTYNYLAFGVAFNTPGANKKAVMKAFTQEVIATQKTDKTINKKAIKFVKSLSREEQKEFFIKFSEAIAEKCGPPEKEVKN